MKSKIIPNASFFIIVLALLAYGCAQAEEKTQAAEEEFVDTGVLAVESYPGSAEVYVDNELKGETPFTLYNLPAGPHSIAIKKAGYSEFQKDVSIKAGRTEEISVTLAVSAPEKSAADDKRQEIPDEPSPESAKPPTSFNRINLSSFAMYFDFDNGLFTELRAEKSDVFSRRYDKYIDLVALAPAKMEIVSKPLNEVKKEDCIAANSGVAQLNSGQVLCVISAEGAFFAVGGSWQTSLGEIEWVALS